MEWVGQLSPTSWEELSDLLIEVKERFPNPTAPSRIEFDRRIKDGIAFLTFDYGIDGVSIEISKYARALESILYEQGNSIIHFIGGDFYPQAESVLKSGWRRFQIDGTNGWSKWDDGKWFSALFQEDMPKGSPQSIMLAGEIYQQAISIITHLGAYIVENAIAMIIPVNIASNPGNLALTLAFALVSESLGIGIINSNHDFYWEGGKPASDRAPGEPPGVRDHFFRNMGNKPFFDLFTSLYPWNGRNWLQVNINKLQSRTLQQEFSFAADRVFELSTAVSAKFFEDYSLADIKNARLRMGYILSDGKPILKPHPVEQHIDGLTGWMANQHPLILGAQVGLTVDPTSDDLIYLLQPTRVIARKRIERDLHLISALLAHPAFRGTFDENENLQLILHVTGPTPIEHQADLEVVLNAYQDVLDSVPGSVANRLFLAFSVGNEYHPAFEANNLSRMTIEDIYRMASAVVFPSETEGRGLPIVEASASKIPLICSKYHPVEVFADVIGDTLADQFQIQYTHFPEGEFSPDFLNEVTDLLLHPENIRGRLDHNQEAVRLRYSPEALKGTFEKFLGALWQIANQ
jgi:glycosyltransferase involved in cell wall biosynthesis